MRWLFYFFTYLFVYHTTAQDSSLLIGNLDTIEITAFKSQQFKQAPISVGVLTKKQLQQFSLHQTVALINSIAGVKLEERSPSSFRLQIRGNLLRSPFGVRNIKVYYNNIPLTDAGGNTYLNLIEIEHVQQIEIVKGPSASLYGMGNNGVVLLHNKNQFTSFKKHTLQAHITGGSFGLRKQHVQYQFQNKKLNYSILQSHTKSNGYRQQSAVEKNTIQLHGSYKPATKHQLNWLAFYTALQYQTPGALTLAQMQSNPTLARQATSTLPSAIQQQTAIYNTTTFASLQHIFSINNQFTWHTNIAGNFTHFKNPFITNYEQRNEKNFSVRSQLNYKKNSHLLNAGLEIIRGNYAIHVYDNNSGQKGNLQFNDRVLATQALLFVQHNYTKNKLQITTGISLNKQQYLYKRLGNNVYTYYSNASTNWVAMPRINMGYTIPNSWLIYATISKGFSPASIQEIRPSDGNFYNNLQPENGWNFEVGIKGNAVHKKLNFELSIYSMRLQNAIVRRLNAAGADFFVNAGTIQQQGIECSYSYTLYQLNNSSISVQGSLTHQPHFFNQYQNGNTNFSNNAVTGVPNFLMHHQIQFIYKKLATKAMLQWVNTTPLNDANTVFANSYRLVQIESNYTVNTKLQIFCGIDNVLNELYSLGNDINAVGNRFYNPAPTRNFFGGIKYGFQ